MPLVVGAAHAVCELDILFLRREGTESLITKPRDEYGGDLDNRIKIFLDARSEYREEQEVPPTDYETWESGAFFCLLEDDSLITKLSIEADVLPGLYKNDERKHVRDHCERDTKDYLDHALQLLVIGGLIEARIVGCDAFATVNSSAVIFN